MKKKFLLLALPVLVMLASCKTRVEVDGGTLGSFVDATVNAATFKSTTVNQSYSTTTNPTQITITGDGPNGGEYIVLVIKNFDKTKPVGTYTIGTSATSGAYAAYHKPNTSSDEIAVSGQIIIDNFSITGIHGTFNFNTQASQITNGSLGLVLN